MSKRFLVIVLALAVVAPVALVAQSESTLVSYMKVFPNAGTRSTCFCEDPTTIKIGGVGEFKATFYGSITADAGEKHYSDGFAVTPLTVKGYGTRSYIDGLGNITLAFDSTRPVKESELKAKETDKDFPAVQTMSLHVTMTIDSMPKVTFRSINPAVVENRDAFSFPPYPGAVYKLRAPVSFERTDQPGQVAATIIEHEPTISGSRIEILK